MVVELALETEIQAIYRDAHPSDERALVFFDRAFEQFEPDQALLTGAPGRAFSKNLVAFVTALTSVNFDRLTKRQNWLSRFTGAALEVRLQLDAMAHGLDADFTRLKSSAQAAREARDALAHAIPALDRARQAHVRLAAVTNSFMAGADASEGPAARLHRRLGNLEAVIASYALARAQMEIALGNMDALLDRYADVEQKLLPVWRCHALTIAQSPQPHTESGALKSLRALQDNFNNVLNVLRSQP